MLELVQSSVVYPHFTLGGEELEKTAILRPIKIFEDFAREGQKSYDLVIRCNKFRSCENHNYGYSWALKLERKKTGKVTKCKE